MIEFELKLPNGARVVGVFMPPVKSRDLPRPVIDVPGEVVDDEQERKSA